MASRPTRLRVPLDRWYRRCPSQKVCFDTKAQALDAAERLMEKGEVNPGCHMTPYLCDECQRWHVANRRIVCV